MSSHSILPDSLSSSFFPFSPDTFVLQKKLVCGRSVPVFGTAESRQYCPVSHQLLYVGRGKAGKWCDACKCTSVLCIAQFSEEPLGFNTSIWKVWLLFSLLFFLLSQTEGLEDWGISQGNSSPSFASWVGNWPCVKDLKGMLDHRVWVFMWCVVG